ncbi:MAG: hypothetical protein Q8R47_06240 [Nanoarchaeota archaeon]|nr:hypothetical protein [Nanoarchaeota archaeon]
MINLEEMAEKVKKVRITFLPWYMASGLSKSPQRYELEVKFDAADDQILGDNLDGGFFENYKSDKK